MQIGSINTQRPIVLAPMEDVTDISFRLICKRLGADIMYTEFVNSEGLVRNSEKTKQKMLFIEVERPFGIQIYGGNEESMVKAAQLAEHLNPDLIDINCGCWVKNVVGQGAGASLLRDLPRMKRLISSVVNAVNLPVTVKTRIGWDDRSIQIVDVATMLEDIGVSALTIHCRTREQGHKGIPNYHWISKVKAAVTIPIIVNGGIDSPEKAKHVFDLTGCDGIMIARGALENPWIFTEIKQYLSTGELPQPPSFSEQLKTLFDHLKLSIKYKGERQGIIEFRKYYSGYLRNLPGVAKLRAELMMFTEMQPIIDQITCYAKSFPKDEFIQDEALAA